MESSGEKENLYPHFSQAIVMTLMSSSPAMILRSTVTASAEYQERRRRQARSCLTFCDTLGKLEYFIYAVVHSCQVRRQELQLR